jgi:hypothetical protein
MVRLLRCLESIAIPVTDGLAFLRTMDGQIQAV